VDFVSIVLFRLCVMILKSAHLTLQRLRFTESDRLLVQIQAYLDNVFDVGALLEDAETKNDLLEHMEELQEHNTQVSGYYSITWDISH